MIEKSTFTHRFYSLLLLTILLIGFVYCLSILNKYVNKEEILDSAVKLYQYKPKTKSWHIVGYKCPYCDKHYQTPRNEFYTHIDKCDGPKTKKLGYDED